VSNNTTNYLRCQSVKFSPKYIKVVKQHNFADVTMLSFRPEAHIRKISATQYIKGRKDQYGKFQSNGEVFDFMPADGRNMRSLRKIFKDLRQLISYNFTQNNDNQMFLTLTYEENMQDDKRLKKDLEIFIKKLGRRIADLEYITIVEPQARGAWHAHILVKSSDKLVMGKDLYMMIHDLWGHGRTTTERLDNVDNIGAYFIAYFSNLEIPDELVDEYQDDIIEKNGKKYIKGERIKFYHDYMQIYRHSRSINKPSSEEFFNSSFAKEFPKVTYEKVREVPLDEERDAVIVNQQRKK